MADGRFISEESADNAMKAAKGAKAAAEDAEVEAGNRMDFRSCSG